ncbi:MAG: aspartate kinase [Clostridia bacterium]|nr:aspartate kinase [Clostridia bacterium]
MDTIVLKFGGSSVADHEKLKLVANRIINLYNKGNNIVVILSAQGKTTDKLMQEAKELSPITINRELDSLLSSGEQVSIAKLAILLNSMGYKAVSLTGWQAGIYTNNTNQDAVIQYIDTARVLCELKERKIVIIAGFQGVNQNTDITTLGRGGSDTTAVAMAAALKAKNCYIFSDVDGVYTTDPNKVKEAKKLAALSYQEMKEVASEGAKVLHNRCVEIGEKFKIPIITKSTFNNKPGTVISDIIEEDTIKSIIKKDVSRISIVGNGVIRNVSMIQQVLDLIKESKLEMLNFEVSESKISITFKDIIEDAILVKIHNKIFS